MIHFDNIFLLTQYIPNVIISIQINIKFIKLFYIKFLKFDVYFK